MFLGIPDPHPDPSVGGTDLRIRIRIRSKMSLIPSTGYRDGKYNSKSCLVLVLT
jgi:hypothetical protein